MEIDVPFSAIGVDHGIEHENRAMKVTGGIIRIANKENALERYLLLELAGSINDRIDNNVKNLLDVFDEFGVDFDEPD